MQTFRQPKVAKTKPNYAQLWRNFDTDPPPSPAKKIYFLNKQCFFAGFEFAGHDFQPEQTGSHSVRNTIIPLPLTPLIKDKTYDSARLSFFIYIQVCSYEQQSGNIADKWDTFRKLESADWVALP